MSRRETRPAVATALAVAACLAALPGCGEDPTDREQIAALVAEVQGAFERAELDDVCAAMTEAARAHVGSIGHGPRQPCAQVLQGEYLKIRQGLRRPDAIVPVLSGLELRGDRAVATLTVSEGARSLAVPLAREDGSWKVDALFGGVPAASQRDWLP